MLSYISPQIVLKDALPFQPGLSYCGFTPDPIILLKLHEGEEVSECEMAGWYHQCNGRELGQIPGDGEGQGGPACCSPWGRKESHMTE